MEKINQIDINSINNLLQQVSIIQKKYNDIAEATGENFNVFQLLNVNHYENTHSSILSYFLNSKGNHGQKDLFLKLFIGVLNDKFLNSLDKKDEFSLTDDSNFHLINKFQTDESESLTEYAAGKIDDEYINGGRIDILLKDKSKSNIIIENKIYAVDQENQLVRYNNFDKNAPIFYLNLYSDNPSEYSKGHLIENKEFFIISYETEIVHWLENSIKECVNKPFIRETLNQYLNLIKELTNQSTNKIMEKEITDVLINNFNSFVQVVENQNAVFEEIIENLHQQLRPLSIKLGLELEFSIVSKKDSGFYFSNEKLNALCLGISFEFEENNYRRMNVGFISNNPEKFDSEKLKDLFKLKFNHVQSAGNWVAWEPFDDYLNWYEYSYKAFNDIISGDFINKIEEKLIKMLEIVKELEKTKLLN